MPEFLEDPSVLTKDKLKSELQAHNVELPGGNSNKDVYVKLYLTNLTAQNKKQEQDSTVDTFSSDEELPWVAISSRSRSSGKVLGAFLAAATVALQYYDAIQMYGGGQLTVTGPTSTAGIFSTYPADYLSVWGGVVDQIIGTAALLLCILALGDQRNTSIPDHLQPLLAGASVLVIGVSMGSNSGYALNPARDFGPRLFTYIAGWGEDVFRAGGGWWWVPIVGPCMGALLGTLVYELLVEVHHPPQTPDNQNLCLEDSTGKTTLEMEEPEGGKPA